MEAVGRSREDAIRCRRWSGGCPRRRCDRGKNRHEHWLRHWRCSRARWWAARESWWCDRRRWRWETCRVRRGGDGWRGHRGRTGKLVGSVRTLQIRRSVRRGPWERSARRRAAGRLYGSKMLKRSQLGERYEKASIVAGVGGLIGAVVGSLWGNRLLTLGIYAFVGSLAGFLVGWVAFRSLPLDSLRRSDTSIDKAVGILALILCLAGVLGWVSTGRVTLLVGGLVFGGVAGLMLFVFRK